MGKLMEWQQWTFVEKNLLFLCLRFLTKPSYKGPKKHIHPVIQGRFDSRIYPSNRAHLAESWANHSSYRCDYNLGSLFCCVRVCGDAIFKYGIDHRTCYTSKKLMDSICLKNGLTGFPWKRTISFLGRWARWGDGNINLFQFFFCC